MPHMSDRRERITGLSFLGLWLGMLGAGLALMTALFHGVGVLVASALSFLSR